VTYFKNWLPRGTRIEYSQSKVKDMQQYGVKTGDFMIDMVLWGSDCPLFMEHSPHFESYLRNQKADAIATREGLERRHFHKIVPPRLFVPLFGSRSTLPDLTPTERYIVIAFSGCLNTERYIEWTLGAGKPQ